MGDYRHMGWWRFIDGRLQAHGLAGIHRWAITGTWVGRDSLLGRIHCSYTITFPYKRD